MQVNVQNILCVLQKQRGWINHDVPVMDCSFYYYIFCIVWEQTMNGDPLHISCGPLVAEPCHKPSFNSYGSKQKSVNSGLHEGISQNIRGHSVSTLPSLSKQFPLNLLHYTWGGTSRAIPKHDPSKPWRWHWRKLPLPWVNRYKDHHCNFQCKQHSKTLVPDNTRWGVWVLCWS